jgi:CubicO group peptidase (beta-lactamase class C family)
VTLRDMFSHRSGLPDYAGDDLEELGYGRAEILRRLRSIKPGSSFRSHWAYTNFGLTEAAVAAARATGEPWEVLAAEKLYKPLGMASTSSRFDDVAAARNRALLHMSIDGKWVVKQTRNPDAQSPAGGVSSTARDLVQWMRLQLGKGKFEGKQLIDADALAETHRPVIVLEAPAGPTIAPGLFYALGWTVSYDDKGRAVLYHAGDFSAGAATIVTLIPSEELGMTVLTNAIPIGVRDALVSSFIDLARHGKVQKDWFATTKQSFDAILKAALKVSETDYSKSPAQRLPSLPADAYAGTYRNEYFGDISISAKDGDLVVHMGPQKTSYPVKQYNRDVFTFSLEGTATSGIFFQVGPDQKATSAFFEELNKQGLGTFVRLPTQQ